MAAASRRATESPPHRGRVQAQGGGVEKSRKWAQATPPTAADVLGMLDQLEAELGRADRRAREEAFAQAREFIRSAAEQSGLDAPVSKSFPRKNEGDIRVDLEVKAGKACVLG